MEKIVEDLDTALRALKRASTAAYVEGYDGTAEEIKAIADDVADIHDNLKKEAVHGS